VRPRLLLLFPTFEPVMMRKDVGEIPRALQDHFGWESTLAVLRATAATGALPKSPLRLVDLGVRGTRLQAFMTAARYILREGSEYDALLLYHTTLESIGCAYLFRMRNAAAPIVLKMDLDSRAVSAFNAAERPWKQRALEQLLGRSPIDVLTVETSVALSAMKDVLSRWKKPGILVPNGFSLPWQLDIENVVAAKKRVILTAGRLGMPQKNNEMLIDAVRQIPRDLLAGWKVVLAGSSDHEHLLRRHVERVLAERPDLRSVFELPGVIDSAEKMSQLYRSARIFCLTSRWESYGLVLPEAMAHACFVISTDVGAARDLLSDGTCGDIVPEGDTAAFARALEAAMRDEQASEVAGRRAHQRIARDWGWERVLAPLDAVLRCRRQRSRASATELGQQESC
jgi:glycosyltransferase involved in cell wall biosynthesis